jgi:hypothetical protein
MAFAKASIGAANYAVSIMAGHHQLLADEGLKLGGKTSDTTAPGFRLSRTMRANAAGIDQSIPIEIGGDLHEFGSSESW